VVQGAVEPVSPDDEGLLTPSLTFTEPNLAFSLATRTADTVELRVHLSYESAPPWLDIEERRNMWQFFVIVRMATAELAEVANMWDKGWPAFPERP
jgi:hypothetical protein